MPYLYNAAIEAHRTGVPVLRAMMLEFPDDPACLHLDRQYMLGERLLVAPVFSDEGAVSYYVPAGRWTHLRTGEVIDGPVWRREHHGYNSLPLLVRPNTVLTIGGDDTRPDYDYTRDVTLEAYALDDGAQVTASVPAADGTVAAVFTVRRDGATVQIDSDGNAPGWRVLLVGVPQVRDVDGGTVKRAAQGVMVTPEEGSRLRITLPS
jgi:alpha-D-xyloside xylohydrolase